MIIYKIDLKAFSKVFFSLHFTALKIKFLFSVGIYAAKVGTD